MAEGCRRLIKNAILCWNYLYLSQRTAGKGLGRRKELTPQSKTAQWWHGTTLTCMRSTTFPTAFANFYISSGGMALLRL